MKATAWLSRDALEVAPALLGWELVMGGPEGRTVGRIVETEAYHGAEDPASHAFRGRSLRTAPMFEGGGVIYVYLSYGLHTCLNLVTGPAGEAQAVLIRALEPTQGLELMHRRRGNVSDINLANGPGKLTQALGITLGLNGKPIGETLKLRPPSRPIAPGDVLSGPRIGIRSATERPWRFWIRDNAFVSGARPIRRTASKGEQTPS